MKADSASVMKETIVKKRVMHVPELARMSADNMTQGRIAVVKGDERLTGAEVVAPGPARDYEARNRQPRGSGG